MRAQDSWYMNKKETGGWREGEREGLLPEQMARVVWIIGCKGGS